MNFICPICAKNGNVSELKKTDRSFVCEHSHGFDIAKEGYVNLLLSDKMKSKNPGDNKDMVVSRRNFLENGHYQPLLTAICEIIKNNESALPSGIFADFGCGEGYYTETAANSFRKNSEICGFVGVDISKEAVKLASKRHGIVSYAVGSVYEMPIADNSCSLALNVFSPLALDELKRTVKKDGLFIYVVPSSEHLWEIEQTVYDTPYKNVESDSEYDGFELVNKVALRYKTKMNSVDIMACFGMTPYFWRSPKDGIDRLKQIPELCCTVGFDVLVYKRI